ncbi:MAG: hypothetical protein PHG82_04460 [Candidatus Gracilibacteria bacterium]|nr:hypothetical protein [Candidatus Gracilibacteria bacterium]
METFQHKFSSHNVLGLDETENIKDLEDIIKNIGGNYELLNQVEIRFNNRILAFYEGQILLLPKLEGYNEIEKYYEIGGKRIFVFKYGRKGLVLNSKNTWDILKFDSEYNISGIKLIEGLIIFDLKNRNNYSKTAILEENNTLNEIPFKSSKSLKEIYTLGDRKIFRDHGLSLFSEPFPMLNSQNEWEEFTGPENVYDLEFIKEVNGKEILLYRMCQLDRLLLINNIKIELPEGVGEIEDVVEHNGNLLFLFKNGKNTSAKRLEGMRYILNENNSWSEKINYPKGKKSISEIYKHDGVNIFEFYYGELFATLDNANNWQITKEYYSSSKPNEFKLNNGKTYYSFRDDGLLEVVKNNDGNILFVETKCYLSSINSIKILNGITIVTGSNSSIILNQDNTVFEFNIEGKKIKNFHEIKNGDKIIYSFDINGTSRLFTQEEFMQLVKISDSIVNNITNKVEKILN